MSSPRSVPYLLKITILKNGDFWVLTLCTNPGAEFRAIQKLMSVLAQLENEYVLTIIGPGVLGIAGSDGKTQIDFMIDNNGLSITLDLGNEQRNVTCGELMEHFGMLFVGYQLPHEDILDQLQVYIECKGETIFVLSGHFRDIEVLLGRAYNFANVLMALQHRDIQYPADLNFSLYTFTGADGLHHSVEMLHNGNILVDDIVMSPQKIIRRFH